MKNEFADFLEKNNPNFDRDRFFYREGITKGIKWRCSMEKMVIDDLTKNLEQILEQILKEVG
jgi:hypothetical protein